MDFRTKEGGKANNWATRSLYDTLSGEDWVLVKDDPDPRKRQWVKYDKNGKVVNKKTGALNIGGNLTQWGKGGIKNVGNTANAAGKLASAFDIRDRVADEGKPSPSNINEYFNSILQERWDNATTEEEKASVKDLLASFNVGLQKGIITEETGAAPTSVIPESFSEYRRRTKTEDEPTAGGKVQETIQSGQPLEENQYQTWNTDMDEDKGVVGTVGDKEWTKDFEDPETAAKREWLENSANTPAAKAFAEGTDQQKKDWGNLRWEARKRHKKLFDYNTDKEK